MRAFYLLSESGNGRGKEKGGQRKMKKCTKVLFIGIWILLLMILSIRVLGAEVIGKSSIIYPTTPEGVVDAFCKASFNPAEIERVNDIGDIEERLQFTREDFIGGSDCFHVALSYKIIKLKENMKEAKVKVIYDYLGGLCGDGSFSTREKTEEITYKLTKSENVWKIFAPVTAPYISVKTAIRILEWEIEHYRKDSERVAEARKSINVLKKYRQD
jgi:hypothetical protein